MIKDILFVLKMLVVTIVVVLIMQVHIGEKTVEEHFHLWVKNSVVVDYVEEAVDGGTSLVRGLYQKADNGIHMLLAKTVRKHEKKERTLGMNLKRHDDPNGTNDKNVNAISSPILSRAHTSTVESN